MLCLLQSNILSLFWCFYAWVHLSEFTAVEPLKASKSTSSGIIIEPYWDCYRRKAGLSSSIFYGRLFKIIDSYFWMFKTVFLPAAVFMISGDKTLFSLFLKSATIGLTFWLEGFYCLAAILADLMADCKRLFDFYLAFGKRCLGWSFRVERILKKGLFERVD